MEKLDIICVGTLKEKYLKELCAEYQKRLSRYCKITIKELPEYKVNQNPSQTEIDKALDIEGKAMLSACDDGAYKIALCIEGDMVSSEQLSKTLDSAMLSRGKMALFIGSSHGICDSVKKACDKRISMSKMTFPHQLARGMLLEQIYRAYKIRNKEAYHK